MRLNQIFLALLFIVGSSYSNRELQSLDFLDVESLIYAYEHNIDLNSLPTKKGNDHIRLENELLRRLDGIPYMIDGINIKESMVIIRDLLEIQIGKLDKKTGKRAGRYSFKGGQLGIHYLVKSEREKLNSAFQKELTQAFEKAKKEVKTMLQPFIDQVSATRWIVAPIMEEWTEKRKRTNTFLLKWTECKGDEIKVFNKLIGSIQDLDRFCTDLRIFLGDLIYNCPKGYAQFQDLLKQHENK
ncbi:hypothetical protein HOM50_05045 [bacterium]|jgi:hypothetical protein|nr:hypothetical protein [bacterium]MBT5015748.1 hypothetical protein [bacterium]